MHTIVVGYDGSEHSDRALDRALEIGKAMGAGLRVVSVANVSGLSGGYGRPRSGGVAPVDPADEEDVKADLEKARARVADSGVEVHLLEARGDPADVVVQEAKDHDAGLIVVGTHGRNWAERLVQGSVSTKVVQQAECDVLVVR